jgi:hypothetical protein
MVFSFVGWIVAIRGRSPERTAVVEEGRNVKSSLSGSFVEAAPSRVLLEFYAAHNCSSRDF